MLPETVIIAKILQIQSHIVEAESLSTDWALELTEYPYDGSVATIRSRVNNTMNTSHMLRLCFLRQLLRKIHTIII